MTERSATARANSNIAFIKYWGNTNHNLRLPQNGSLSMNLDGLYTETTVHWDNSYTSDNLTINNSKVNDNSLNRVSLFLNEVRQRYNIQEYATVLSKNNFPMGAGIASSASAFAALALASTSAVGLTLEVNELSTLARLGSGSASRSVPDGFVEWYAGKNHEDSYAKSISPANHWDIIDVIAITSSVHKPTGSTQGHHLASTSDLQQARIDGADSRLTRCRQSILDRDFMTFAQVVEEDSNLMHAVMMTSNPPLFYWEPASVAVMKSVLEWRKQGINVCYTLDAGPNVHCLCLAKDMLEVERRLGMISGVEKILKAKPGAGVHLI